jgi:hypothetical protein
MATTLSQTELLKEINLANTPLRPLNTLNVTFDVPTAETGDDYNTRVTVLAVPGRTYINQVDVLYKRIVLADIAPDAQVRSTEPFTKESIISLLNATFQMFLSVEDLEDFTPPTLQLNETASLTLTAKPESLGWLGSFDVEFMYGRTLLDSIVGLRYLPVLTHPTDPKLGKKSARVLTWGKDFTSLRDSMLPDIATGTYKDYAAFSTACGALEIPPWTKGPCSDNATSAIPDSNQAFDRVVIQSAIQSSGMSGDLYFHYNTFDKV